MTMTVAIRSTETIPPALYNPPPAAPAVFSVMRTDTHLTVADGATLVIGGMLQSKIQKVEDKTKLLGDLPVVGRMFQSEAYAPVRTAVVFLVTVKVVDPTGRSFRDR